METKFLDYCIKTYKNSIEYLNHTKDFEEALIELKSNLIHYGICDFIEKQNYIYSNYDATNEQVFIKSEISKEPYNKRSPMYKWDIYCYVPQNVESLINLVLLPRYNFLVRTKSRYLNQTK